MPEVAPPSCTSSPDVGASRHQASCLVVEVDTAGVDLVTENLVTVWMAEAGAPQPSTELEVLSVCWVTSATQW